MKTVLAKLFSRSGPGLATSAHAGRRRRLPRQCAAPLGGETLEPRLALTATVGTQGFGNIGVTTVNTGNINTATVFTLSNVRSTASQTGYFVGLPTFSSAGVWSFTTTVGTSLSFSNPAFGTFQSSTITQESNTVTPGQQRTFYVLGTMTGGTLGTVTPSPVPASLTITFTQSGAAISSSATLSIPPSKAKAPVLVAANDLGCDSTPRIFVVDPYTGVSTSFVPYPDVNFRGGVRVAVGDVDSDPNTLEIVAAPGPGRVGEVRVFSMAGVEKPSFRYLPFGAGYVRGVELAVGDIDGDGRDDLVTAASRGQGSVNVARSTGTAFVSQPAKSFTAFGGTYTGGASVAVGGVNRIVVGSGVGLPPTVKVYDVSGASPRVASQFAPNVPTGTAGVTVSTQYFSVGANPEIMVAGGRNAMSAIGVYRNETGPPTKTYNNFATRAKPNAPVYAAAAALTTALADTVFMAQGDGGVGTILKVNATTGVVDPTFRPTFNGQPIVSPLRIATRVSR